ncbi:MAG: TGS domain-containing protein, partial [Bacteroidota bacterium]
LENPEANALDFIDDFKLNLFADEIYVFTPGGDLKKLPKGATALDFAFEIHSDVGAKCMGAKVNTRLVPLSHELKSGDQVEILTSKNQNPKEDWLNFVITGKAKAKIKSSLKEEMKEVANDGKEILQRKFNNWKIDFKSVNISLLEKYYGIPSATELYYLIAKNKIDLRKIKQLKVVNGTLVLEQTESKKPKAKEQSSSQVQKGSDTLILNDNNTKLEYKLAACCNPIAGDDVFAFVTVNDGIKVHRTKCPNATQLLGSYNYRVLKAQWESQKEQEFLAKLTFKGIDDMGLVQKITNTISQELHINMKSISFESNDGIFEGKIGVFVHNTRHLNDLIKKLKQIDGVRTVKRIEGT